jgi:hypothetical protein
MALANIDRAILGVDTAKGWRGRYYTQKTALKLMGRGGILRMATSIARRCKWRSLGRLDLAGAQDGDRGIACTRHALVCVIRFRGFWVGRHHGIGNVIACDGEIVRAWSLL